jgi:hypothetical protein
MNMFKRLSAWFFTELAKAIVVAQRELLAKEPKETKESKLTARDRAIDAFHNPEKYGIISLPDGGEGMFAVIKKETQCK